jgi:hypothetical protein
MGYRSDKDSLAKRVAVLESQKQKLKEELAAKNECRPNLEKLLSIMPGIFFLVFLTVLTVVMPFCILERESKNTEKLRGAAEEACETEFGCKVMECDDDLCAVQPNNNVWRTEFMDCGENGCWIVK